MNESGHGPFVPWWQRAFGLAPPVDPACARMAVARLLPVLGPLLARHPVAAEVPEEPAEAAEAAYRRLLLARQAETLDVLRAGGSQVLPIKGHDAARRYDPPSARILGDCDLLVRPEDLAAAVRTLERQGFSIRQSPQGLLGVTSDVSFHPLVSPDGLVSVDLHTAPDAFPLSAALDAGQVFAAARDGRVAPHHAAVIAISNVAKERFAPYAWRHLLDLARLSMQDEVDWSAVGRITRAAGMTPAAATALGALRRLGLPPERLPPAARDPASARRLADDLGWLHMPAPGMIRKTVREIIWCYEAPTVLRIWRHRIAGLARPRSGLPPGTATAA